MTFYIYQYFYVSFYIKIFIGVFMSFTVSVFFFNQCLMSVLYQCFFFIFCHFFKHADRLRSTYRQVAQCQFPVSLSSLGRIWDNAEKCQTLRVDTRVGFTLWICQSRPWRPCLHRVGCKCVMMAPSICMSLSLFLLRTTIANLSVVAFVVHALSKFPSPPQPPSPPYPLPPPSVTFPRAAQVLDNHALLMLSKEAEGMGKSISFVVMNDRIMYEGMNKSISL